MRPRVVALVATAVMAVVSPALADDASCIQSYEATQTLRKAGKLREARAEALKCADASCPAVLTKDCQKWQGEIEAALPSVLFVVKDKNGEPLTNVKITANGQPLVDRIDATPVLLEPGEITLHYESPEGRGLPVDQTITMKEGEKSKMVSVQLGRPAPPPETSRPLPVGPIAFGAAGVVALGVGTVFAILGSGAESDLDSCKPRCSSDDVNGVSTKYAVADILFAAGAVSLVAAAYMFLTRPPAATAPASGAGALRPFVVRF